MDTLKEFVGRAVARTANDHERIGQAFFSTLFEYDPALADSLVGSDVDPFYDDTKIGPFLAVVLNDTELS